MLPNQEPCRPLYQCCHPLRFGTEQVHPHSVFGHRFETEFLYRKIFYEAQRYLGQHISQKCIQYLQRALLRKSFRSDQYRSCHIQRSHNSGNKIVIVALGAQHRPLKYYGNRHEMTELTKPYCCLGQRICLLSWRFSWPSLNSNSIFSIKARRKSWTRTENTCRSLLSNGRPSRSL